MMWTGSVFKDPFNAVNTFCAGHTEFAREFSAVCPNPKSLLFAVSGPDKDEVASIIKAVRQAAEDLALPSAQQCESPSEAGDCYVYAYFNHGNAELEQCFYIGKGTATREASYLGRWTSHIKETLDTAPEFHNKKMSRILDWIHAQGLTGQQHKDVRSRAAGSLVRKLYVFKGRYAESQAFYVEYFLICHALGIYFVANDTNGNATCGTCSAIGLPNHLNTLDALHQEIWKRTVDEFTINPWSKSLSHTWRPALITLFAAPYAVALDEFLHGLGVVPYPMYQQGRLANALMSRPNIQVTGASDATLTYSILAHRNFRLELRFGATQCLTSISFRPYSQNRGDISAFLTYMDDCVITEAMVGHVRTIPGMLNAIYELDTYVKNRSNWPFYKPYAPGSDGKKSIWFDIEDPMAPTSGSTDWVAQGHFDLNLVQAIELITRGFD